MKKLLNYLLITFIASAILLACSKDSDNMLRTIATSDTTILDCFTPKDGITVYIGGDTITFASDRDFGEDLVELITSMEPFTIQFPIDILLADGTPQTLNSMDDLIAILEDCGLDFEVIEEEEEDDDDDDTDESDDDTDDDADESDDDTDESDDDADESGDDTDESDDDADESDDDADESDDDADDDTDESDDDTDNDNG